MELICCTQSFTSQNQSSHDSHFWIEILSWWFENGEVGKQLSIEDNCEVVRHWMVWETLLLLPALQEGVFSNGFLLPQIHVHLHGTRSRSACGRLRFKQNKIRPPSQEGIWTEIWKRKDATCGICSANNATNNHFHSPTFLGTTASSNETGQTPCASTQSCWAGSWKRGDSTWRSTYWSFWRSSTRFPRVVRLFFKQGIWSESFRGLHQRFFQSCVRTNWEKRLWENPNREGEDNIGHGTTPLHHVHFVEGPDKNITAFWKAIIGFISPEHKQFVKKIKVSYSTCVREAQKRHIEIHARHLEMFRDCYYFSLALDTAQLGRDNFLSCVARFGFDDHISQEIIIFEKVGGTKGQELARLIFERLEEKMWLRKVDLSHDGWRF